MRCLTLDECQQWREAQNTRTEWAHQATCITPLTRLPWFSSELVGLLQPISHALLIIDQVVFDVPPSLEDLRRDAGECRPIYEAPGHAFEGDPDGFQKVLEASLSGWIDFRVLFSPSKYALLADHNEFTTFFSESLQKIAEFHRMLNDGNVSIETYTAEAP
jgi:hypothetical protein